MANLLTQNGALFTERAIVYPVHGEACVAVYHAGLENITTGVVFVVGGRQYRAGAHRQFVLLARALAQAGFHVLRFDTRGMGDSGGDTRSYLDTSEDLHSAVLELKKQASTIKRIVLWGLCDGATATIMNANSLPDVNGVILVNPWITTDVGFAKTEIKHYYQTRLLQADFWKKFALGKLDVKTSIRSIFRTALLALNSVNKDSHVADDLPALVLGSLRSYNGMVLIILSQSDLTAMEFYDAFNAWYKCLRVKPSRLSISRIDADHTFSGQGQLEILVTNTLEFVRACDQQRL